MWHQVKSYGAENRAVAFLFSQFEGHDSINTTDCGKTNPDPVTLADVDVDLQYSGTGIMSMGNFELNAVMHELKKNLVDPKKGYVTKKRVFTLIVMNHDNANKVKSKLVEKAKAMYKHFLELAGGVKENMDQTFVDGLTRAQVRPCYMWIFPLEPSNTYEHEYSYFLPERLSELLQNELPAENDIISKDVFVQMYTQEGGTEKFAQEFWSNLVDGEDVTEISKAKMNMTKALEKYEYYRKEDPENEEEDEDAVIITPQGHKSQPKHERGGYAQGRDEEEEQDAGREEQGQKDEL